MRRWATLCKVQQSTPPPSFSTALLLSASSGSFTLLGGRAVLKGKNYWETLPELAERSRAVEKEEEGEKFDCWTLHRVAHLLISA
jgi:hypothetical protein